MNYKKADEIYVNLNDPDKIKVRNIWINMVRSKAIEYAQEEILMATDEEILTMFPLTKLDYEVLEKTAFLDLKRNHDEDLFWQLYEELMDVEEEIKYCENSLKDSKINYLQKNELHADLLYAQRKKYALEKEIKGIKDKYDRRDSSLPESTKKRG